LGAALAVRLGERRKAVKIKNLRQRKWAIRVDTPLKLVIIATSGKLGKI